MNSNQQIVISQHGAPEVLELMAQTSREPKPGEVKVKVVAAGVAYADVMAQRGGYPIAPKPPFTPGYDFAGVVEQVGEGVSGFAKGDHVLGLNPVMGCYAQQLCISAQYLVPYPSHLPPEKVCSLVLNYLTAYCLLHKKTQMKAGQTLLVHSAAGGVGSALLQLAALAGIKVFGTASAGKLELVRKLGATPIDYQKADFVEEIREQCPLGVDVAVDPFGGDNLRRSYQSVRRGGQLVSYGFAGKHFGGLKPMLSGLAQLTWLRLLPDGRKVDFCALPAEAKKDPLWYRQALAELIDLLVEGKIDPIIGEVVPLQEASKAHTLIERGAVTGKVILQCA
ncbi:zinc-binding dehydrogenase [Aliagarivorans marinus]|uniref:zinc-binding dehydrogenase n=1 Tax=Aliagarivorans marinus TaxID=561965 RepID=UPI000418747C|nr:zinc-binding dehydrogenase [Aliagarivorans marinus]